MKKYNLDSKLTFGKFAGLTIRELITLQPDYIEWCALNLDHFYINQQTILKAKSVSSDFVISEDAIECMEEKYSSYQENLYYLEQDNEYSNQCEEDSFYALTGGQYGEYNESNDWD